MALYAQERLSEGNLAEAEKAVRFGLLKQRLVPQKRIELYTLLARVHTENLEDPLCKSIATTSVDVLKQSQDTRTRIQALFLLWYLGEEEFFVEGQNEGEIERIAQECKGTEEGVFAELFLCSEEQDKEEIIPHWKAILESGDEFMIYLGARSILRKRILDAKGAYRLIERSLIKISTPVYRAFLLERQSAFISSMVCNHFGGNHNSFVDKHIERLVKQIKTNLEKLRKTPHTLRLQAHCLHALGITQSWTEQGSSAKTSLIQALEIAELVGEKELAQVLQKNLRTIRGTTDEGEED